MFLVTLSDPDIDILIAISFLLFFLIIIYILDELKKKYIDTFPYSQVETASWPRKVIKRFSLEAWVST